jgi:hypothetical protein
MNFRGSMPHFAKLVDEIEHLLPQPIAEEIVPLLIA